MKVENNCVHDQGLCRLDVSKVVFNTDGADIAMLQVTKDIDPMLYPSICLPDLGFNICILGVLN